MLDDCKNASCAAMRTPGRTGRQEAFKLLWSASMPDSRTPDFYNIDGLLSDDERQVRDTVAAFVDERVLPIIANCFEHERFPTELIPDMAELGLFGPTLQDYGCAGLNNVAYGLIMQEL